MPLNWKDQDVGMGMVHAWSTPSLGTVRRAILLYATSVCLSLASEHAGALSHACPSMCLSVLPKGRRRYGGG